MFSKKFTLKAVAAFTLVIAIASCSKEEVSVTSSKTQNAKPHPILLEVYKSPTCGCCKKWVSHINEQGFESKVHNYQNFTDIFSIGSGFLVCIADLIEPLPYPLPLQ